jgi:carbonic anhydrase
MHDGPGTDYDGESEYAAMHQLAKGVHKFQREVFGDHMDLFARLADGQAPHTLFITCSDSRINPNLLTQTAPGEIFILRNAGNIVPSWGAPVGGEAATIEYALTTLSVEHIVVCGHSACGAMRAVVEPDLLKTMPAVRQWLAHAETTRRILEENYPGMSTAELISIAIQENVLAQLENLRTHPSVAARIAKGSLALHGWVYKIVSGEVFAYSTDEGQFRPLAEVNANNARIPERRVLGDELGV